MTRRRDQAAPTTIAPAPRVLALVSALLAVLAPLAACTEEKIIRSENLLGRLPNVEGAKSIGGVPGQLDRAEAAAGSKLVITHDDGSITLVLISPRHLVHHLRWALANGEDGVLFEQIISDATKEEFRELIRGEMAAETPAGAAGARAAETPVSATATSAPAVADPSAADPTQPLRRPGAGRPVSEQLVRERITQQLFGARGEILKLLDRMPMANRTPGVLLEPIGVRQFRLRSPVTQGLTVTELWLVNEQQQWRLLWVR